LDPNSDVEKKMPYDRVKNWCREHGMPAELVEMIPSSYMKYGSTLVLAFPPGLPNECERLAAEGWAYVLGMETVLKRMGIKQGAFREPAMERLHGPGGDVIHLENRIRYNFDPERIMFSPGNLPERIRIGMMDMKGETVVDMFAGIGYFSLPAAVHAHASKVISCEINPVAFKYLNDNIRLNGVQNITPLEGDNREVAPDGIADRVIMGYVGTTHLFLGKAFSCLKSEGIIHYHELCPVNYFPEATERRIERAAGVYDGLKMDIMRIARVKSYGPKMLHVVADVKILKEIRDYIHP